MNSASIMFTSRWNVDVTNMEKTSLSHVFECGCVQANYIIYFQSFMLFTLCFAQLTCGLHCALVRILLSRIAKCRAPRTGTHQLIVISRVPRRPRR